MNTENIYNSGKSHLIMKEYGRNVQQMIEITAAVEDDEKRNRMARAIVDLMGQMNPHLRNVEDFKHKLWDHIYIVSDGKLVIDSPYPLPDLKKKAKAKPEPMPYPGKKIRFKHYGKNVESMIEKARGFEDEEKKKYFTECIGNYMKLVYHNWNKDNSNDQTIIRDMKTLSNDELVIAEDANLDILVRSVRVATKSRSNNNNRSSNNRSSKNQGGSNNNNKRRYKKRF